MRLCTITVNENLQELLQKKLQDVWPVKGKRIAVLAVLGLAFKSNTHDMRDEASIVNTKELVKQEAQVVAYDPIAPKNY